MYVYAWVKVFRINSEIQDLKIRNVQYFPISFCRNYMPTLTFQDFHIFLVSSMYMIYFYVIVSH